MATQTQSRSQSISGDFVKCEKCESEATQQHFVEATGRMSCLCDDCYLIVEHKDRISSLEAELAQYKKEKGGK